MNIDDLTIGEVKKLSSLLNTNNNATSAEHPFIGKHCYMRRL